MITPTIETVFAVWDDGAATPRRVTRYSASDTPTPAQQARALRRQRGVVRVEIVKQVAYQPALPFEWGGGTVGVGR